MDWWIFGLVIRELGEAIRREFNVEDAGLITVNDVDLGGDLRTAVVFISILGNASQKSRGLELLNNNRIRLQGVLGKSVVLKYTPTLKFLVDDSLVRGNRILQILDELEKTSPVDNAPSEKPKAP